MEQNTLKKLPMGIENFEKIRKEDFFYVDKTQILIDLLCNWGEVNLFTRPRRFGKSLNMSMIKYFFEIGTDASLFDGLAIAKRQELCEQYMGRFPVVSVSLKGVNGSDYEMARKMMCAVIREEARRLQYLLESAALSEKDKRTLELLMEQVMDDDTLCGSLRLLSELLQKHYGQKVVILIDEYDVPLAKANENGYYKEMVLLIRNLFENALKTNDSLYFAVLTGCLRVAKESIFTGLNNLRVLSIADDRYDEYFGFTDGEVREMLAYYGLTDAYPSVKEWYDGYRFGNADVYCPWDVVNYCDKLRADPNRPPENFWANTSSNSLVRHFIEHVDNGLTQRELEKLIAGETVTKEIRQELTYGELYDSIENIWSVLFTTGYLTQRRRLDAKLFELTIPNREIRSIFTDQIMTMFKEDTEKDGEMVQSFCEALKNGDAPEVERLFTAYLGRTISIRDTFVQNATKENFYHGLLVGILSFKGNWYVRSNREAGEGYSDILIEIDDEELGIVIEVKYAERTKLETVCQKALRQIEEKGYADELMEDDMERVLKYGVACYRKKCRVMCEEA